MANIVFIGKPHDKPASAGARDANEAYDAHALEALRQAGHQVTVFDVRTRDQLAQLREILGKPQYDGVVLANLHWQKSINRDGVHYKVEELLDGLQSCGKPVVVYDSLNLSMQEELRRRDIPFISDNRLARHAELPALVARAFMTQQGQGRSAF